MYFQKRFAGLKKYNKVIMVYRFLITLPFEHFFKNMIIYN